MGIRDFRASPFLDSYVRLRQCWGASCAKLPNFTRKCGLDAETVPYTRRVSLFYHSAPLLRGCILFVPQKSTSDPRQFLYFSNSPSSVATSDPLRLHFTARFEVPSVQYLPPTSTYIVATKHHRCWCSDWLQGVIVYTPFQTIACTQSQTIGTETVRVASSAASVTRRSECGHNTWEYWSQLKPV